MEWNLEWNLGWILEGIQQIDVSVLLFIQEHFRSPLFTEIWKAITFLGAGGWFWLTLGAILLIPKKTRKTGFTVLLAMGIGALLTNVLLKNLVARPRPYDAVAAILPLVKKLSDYSFPSGHTCASFASAFVYLRTVPKKYGISAVILAVLIAFSRLYLGVHYPTDVLGGFFIGTAGALLACKIVELWEKRRKEKE